MNAGVLLQPEFLRSGEQAVWRSTAPQKVFLEGDAIILALLEREGEPMLGVEPHVRSGAGNRRNLLRELQRTAGALRSARSWKLAWASRFQDSRAALPDGWRASHHDFRTRINESDRLSSCSKQVRKKARARCRHLPGVLGPDRRRRQANNSGSAETGTEEMRLNYNVGGICLSEAAFHKLKLEISLCSLDGESGTSPVCRTLDRRAVRIFHWYRSHRQRSISKARHPQELGSPRSMFAIYLFCTGLTAGITRFAQILPCMQPCQERSPRRRNASNRVPVSLRIG